MSRLLRVELLRFRSRRAMKVLGLGAIALVLVIMTVQFFKHAKDDGSAAARFRAERSAQYDQQAQQWEQQRADYQLRRPQMINDPNVPKEAIAQQDQEMARTPPTREEFVAGQEFFCADCRSFPNDHEYHAATDLRDGVKAVAFIFAFAAFLMGATAAGAEWNAGTMQSLLFWESRRARVIVAKVAALVLSVVALAIVGQLLLHAYGYLDGATRGTTAGMTTGWWQSQALVAARGLGLAAFAAAIGFALAFATRNSGFALGVAFVYFAIIQSLLIGWKPWLIRYVLAGPIAAWMNAGFQHHYQVRVPGGQGEVVDKVIKLSTTFGGVALLAYALVAVALAAAWFRSRDVT
ncbi:MAG: type transport system permease protein [Frankiaceae bacterium]|nr:type transport system permease protein [Frankiaceae bacterium]